MVIVVDSLGRVVVRLFSESCPGVPFMDAITLLYPSTGLNMCCGAFAVY